MRFDTLEAWLSWQESLNPRGIELGLDRIRRVLARLDLQNPPFRVVTVAGTNGKGSVATYTAAILEAAGLRCGRYLSPHILHYNERIAINGRNVDDKDLCEAFAAVDHARSDEALTYFEFGTLAAFEIFRRNRVDVAVLEVGLGGRLDAVNVLDADVAVVVSVGLDHVDWLGNEIEGIAREKAGVFRAGRPAIYGSRDMPRAIGQAAAGIGARLLRFGEDFRCTREPEHWRWQGANRVVDAMPLPALPGSHQLANAATAVAAALALDPTLDDGALRNGLRDARLPGRLQSLGGRPEIVLDVGHNPDAAACIARFLLADPRPTIAVLGMLTDKDAPGFARELAPLVEHWHLAGLEGPRGQSAETLLERLRAAGLSIEATTHPDVATAAQVARAAASADARILVLGSFHTVAEFLVYFDANAEGEGGG